MNALKNTDLQDKEVIQQEILRSMHKTKELHTDENNLKENTSFDTKLNIKPSHKNLQNSEKKEIAEKLLLIKDDESISSCYSTFTNKTKTSFFITKETTSFDLYKGLIYMFFSCISKSAYTILSKYSLFINQEISSFQILTYRNYFMMILCLLMTPFLNVKLFSEEFIKPNKILPLITRTVLAIISMSMLIYSIKFLHVSDVYAIFYIYPCILLIFSVIFLKEKIRRFDIYCLFACLIGATLVVKPRFLFEGDVKLYSNKPEEPKFIYYFIVFLAAIIKAVEDLIVKDIGNQVDVLSYSYFFTVIGFVCFPIPLFFFEKIVFHLTFFEYFIIFLNAISTIGYMTFLALALRLESAGRISMINYLQLVFMYISDIAMFDKNIKILDIIGILLIFGYNFTNGLIKANERMKELNKIKNTH